MRHEKNAAFIVSSLISYVLDLISHLSLKYHDHKIRRIRR